MSNTINKQSFTPLYVQIQEDLMKLVKAHEDVTIPFYSDDELSKRYDVNRLTVRRAMEKLVNEGYLYRVRGVGTFVTSPKLDIDDLSSNFDNFETQCRKAGKECVVQVSSLKLVDTPPFILDVMGPASKVMYLERVRTVDNIPMVLDKFYFPAEVYGNITREECATMLMVEIYAKATGQRPVSQRFEAEATNMSAKDARKLNISVKDPVLTRSISVLDADDNVVLTGKTSNRGDLFKLVIKLPLSW